MVNKVGTGGGVTAGICRGNCALASGGTWLILPRLYRGTIMVKAITLDQSVLLAFLKMLVATFHPIHMTLGEICYPITSQLTKMVAPLLFSRSKSRTITNPTLRVLAPMAALLETSLAMYRTLLDKSLRIKFPLMLLLFSRRTSVCRLEATRQQSFTLKMQERTILPSLSMGRRV